MERGYDSSQDQTLIGNRLDFIGSGNLLGLENRFVVGVDASRLELHRQQSTYAGLIIPTPIYNPAKLYYNDFFTSTTDDYKKPDVDIEMNQVSAYVENQLSLTDDLKLVAGLRHDAYDIDYDFKQGLSSPINQLINRKHDKLSYRAGLVFDATKASTFYASYASSFEPGDASASFLTVNAAQTKLDLTQAEQQELGWRMSILDGAAEFTASAYRISKKNMLVSNPTPGAGLLSVGKQTAKGFEVSLWLRPVDEWQIDANFSYVDSKYDDFVHNGVDYSGVTPSSIPDYVANLGVSYAPNRSLSLGAWFRHVASIHTDNIGFSNSVALPAYTTVDLTLAYAYGRNTTFSILLRNVTDELYATTARRDSQVFLGEGRSLELGVNFRF
ncbi:TonB-dependent receptor [Pseudoxanthomonas japonensis]|uniref:TonB-dependent receptor n=1 Tax=Pseudoxanthomonas japonensis TaxID=69284 RepID=UPI0037496E9A